MTSHNQDGNRIDQKKFGTFKGVFTPSVLTILGVIMFLRMGWIAGHAGLWGTITIVTLSSSITFITALSIASTATNMKVGGGGAYYMISRSLGLEVGAAIGIPLYFAQAIGITFYLAGFSEVVAAFFPVLDPKYFSILALFLLWILATISADFALKTQFIIFALIIASLVSLFMSEIPKLENHNQFELIIPKNFWGLFAIFFPAVTGIEAGLSMSGDLKNPSRSLPWGSILAVLVGYVIYLSIPIFLLERVSFNVLKQDALILEKIAKWRPLIILGVLGASLSSALGGMLGAPRTLQALAKDKLIPNFLSKESGKNNSPKIATIVTFLVSLSAIFIGNLDSLAPILTMFFLTSYGVLNFSAGVESLIANPSWRPDFESPWVISIVGGFVCFSAMFMINAGATLLSLSFTFLVYYITKKREMTVYWGDMRRGILNFLAKFSMEKLASLPKNTKSWRPNVLVFSGSPTKRWYLIELGNAFASRAGFLSVATIIPPGSNHETRLSSSEKTISEYLNNRKVAAFVRVSVSEDIISGMTSLVRDYGLGPIVPNTIILGETEQEDNFKQFAEMIIKIYQAERNCLIVRVPDENTKKTELIIKDLKKFKFKFEKNENKKIIVWWGRKTNNAHLSLAFGYLLQNSKAWDGGGLCVKSIVSDKSELKGSEDLMQNLIKESRLTADIKLYCLDANKKEIFNKIKQESEDGGFIFIGMTSPDLENYSINPEKVISDYANYYKELLQLTEGFPPMAFVIAAENLDFHRIFIPQ